MTDLTGFTVGITADRRSEDQAVMFRRLGATVIQGPTMRTEAAPADDLLRRTEQVIEGPPQYLIANTGLGIRTWFAKASEWGLEERLRDAFGQTKVIARGPKAAGAVTSAGLELWWRAPGEQLHEVADHLLSEGVAGRRVVFQLQGRESHEITQRLEAGGAEVVEVSVYRWVEPAGGPAIQLVEQCCDGGVHAVTFTAGPQVRGLFEIAEGMGKAEALQSALNSSIVVGCIGPVCAAVATEEGIARPVVPANWRLGSLVKAVADALVPPPPTGGG